MNLRVSRPLILVLALCSIAVLYAQESGTPMVKPDKEYKPATGLENWTYQYDTSTLKPGTYNILARAIDSAGNVSFSTPFNLIVDPESDKPIVRIVNPLAMARVGADLNIVGSCVDDDAVAAVDIKLDNDEWVRAQGTDYWSYYLKTAALADGPHSLAVRGIDSNGLAGSESHVSFQLDRTKPLNTVTAPSFGSFVSGRLSVNGSVYDANGLSRVSYSLDSGATWVPLPNSYNKNTRTATFSLGVDTKKMPDGPTVLWLRSVDGVGSEGTAVFLYFVDNTKPDITIIAPSEDELINGACTIAGRVHDAVGVASLQWAYEKDAGTIALTPGNPYFSARFMAPDKAGAATVRFTATDTAGNVQVVAVTRQIDPRADLPVVSLAYPVAGSMVDDAIRISGSARDDDGVASIVWKLDAGPETAVPTSGPFSFTIDSAASGPRTLSIRAIDVNGLAGPWLATPFSHAGAAPRLVLARATDAAGERAFVPGMALSTLEGRAAISGSLEAANPLVDLSYTINDGAPVKLTFAKTATGATFTVPIPASLPYGVLSIQVSATDSFGKVGVARAPVIAIDYTRPRVGPTLDFGLATEPGADAPATVRITDASPLEGTFVTPFDGETIRTVSLEPPTPLVRIGAEGNIVSVQRLADGASGPTSVVIVTARGHRFASGPYLFKTDMTAPTVSIAGPVFGSWVKGTVTITATASDGDKVASVEFAANGGSWTALAAAGGEYRGSLDASGLSGPVRLDVRATDAAGNSAVTSTAFMADSTPPAPARLLPESGDAFAGQTLFAFSPGEPAQNIASIQLGKRGVFTALALQDIVSFVAQPSDGPLVLRIADRAGNVTELDPAAGLRGSSTAVDMPPALATLKTNTAPAPETGAPAAVFTGSDAAGALSWSAPFIDSADESRFPAYANAAIRASGAVALNAVFSGIAPDVKKPVAMWGLAPDAINQPLAIKPDKTGSWTATFKLPARPDGLAALWVAVQQADGATAYTRVALDYDSTPPAIALVAPAAGSAGKLSAAGQFSIAVRASDARGIASMSYEYGSDKGDLAPLPGSGDAVRIFRFQPKSAQATIVLRAIDGSGNRSAYTASVLYDQAADTPGIRFLAPSEGAARADQNPFLIYAVDDDAIGSIAAVIDGAPYSADGPGPLYAITAASLAAGRRTATAVAIDSGGLTSARTTLSFGQLGTAPTVRIASATPPGGSGQAGRHTAGSSLPIDGKLALQATIAATNGLARLEYALNGGAWTVAPVPKPEADGTFSLRVVPPATLPYERALVAVRATDTTGAVTEATTSLYRVAPAREIPAVVAEGVYLYDSRIESTGRVVLGPGDSIGALWYGRPLQSLGFEPAVPSAQASFDGSSLTIRAVAEGGALSRPSVLVVRTVDGDEFKSAPLMLVVDAAAPALALSEPAPGTPVRGAFRLAGTASDPNGMASVAWSIDGGATWTPIEPSKGAPVPAEGFATIIPVPSTEGLVTLLVRAADNAGASNVAMTTVLYDDKPPSIVFETPRPVDTVNGLILVSGYADDFSAITGIEFSADGASWEPLELSSRGAAPAMPRDASSPSGRVTFGRLVDLGSLPAGGTQMAFRATDAPGNQNLARPLAMDPPAFMVDIDADKPTIQVQIPADEEVMRSDFVVSGMAFDDDGVAALFWRLDGGAWNRLDGSNGFAVPLKLLDLADNEHSFDAYAVDVNGVKGDETTRAFRISREEPVGSLTSPDVSLTNRGIITLRGTASDANGITSVAVSFDNGATYNNAAGTTDWSYVLDTRVVPDGVHSIYIKLLDGYETPGFAAGLLSVDNTAPTISLDVPSDGAEGTGSIIAGGRVADGMALKSLSIELSKLGATTPERVIPVTTLGVFSRSIDLADLPPGWYNLKAVALDRAGNAAYDSSDIVVLEARKADSAELFFPAQGEHISGTFTLDGRIVSSAPAGTASISLNGRPFAVVDPSGDGWFSLAVTPDMVDDGELTFRAETVSERGSAIVSEPRTIEYTHDGPWIDIAAVVTGDFIVGRPYLSGAAGWTTPAPDKSDKAAVAQWRSLVEGRSVIKVEISRDNGKTYEEAKGKESFRYRLETQEYPNGTLRLTIRATFKNGETAIRKRMVVLDTEKPRVAILKPSEGRRYNGVLSIEGTAGDTNGLAEVAVVVRSGDKASYEVPGFIQGSYLDAHLLGATRFEAGLGLSFFQDNVKLQVQLGQGFDAQPSWDNLFGYASADTPAAELSRFGGYTVGAKLLANLAYLPFSYWFGPDWDFFSMSFALGASFTYFSQTTDIASMFSPTDGKYMVLSGVVGQWEFAKFTFDWPVFRTIGLYLEGGLIFIPSEASTSLDEFIRPNVALGMRVGLF